MIINNRINLVVFLIIVVPSVANSFEPHYHSINDYNVEIDFSSDTWVIQNIVFEEYYEPVSPSLVFFEGEPSFSFTNASEGIFFMGPVIYAELEGTIWCTDTVFNGEHISNLQMLPDGTPCLSTSPCQSLADSTWTTFITRTAEGWTHTNLYDVTNQHKCSNIELAFDQSGNPHILADVCNGSGAWITYAHFDGTDWIIKDDFLPHGMPSYPISTAIVLDNEDNPHLFYHDKHSFFQSNYWWLEILDMDYPETARLDPSGYLHVIHSSLEHIYDAGPAWINETITSGGGSSSCIGADGTIHVAYRTSNKDLYYAYRDSTSWTVSQIDWVGDVGSQPSIALDDIGNPCILYRDNDNDCLKLAWFGYETGIETNHETPPSIINLLETWPNPSFGSTLVVFSVSTPAEFDLDVFDISGRLVRSESLGFLTTGQHSIELINLTAGIYTITLSSGLSVKSYRTVML